MFEVPIRFYYFSELSRDERVTEFQKALEHEEFYNEIYYEGAMLDFAEFQRVILNSDDELCREDGDDVGSLLMYRIINDACYTDDIPGYLNLSSDLINTGLEAPEGQFLLEIESAGGSRIQNQVSKDDPLWWLGEANQSYLVMTSQELKGLDFENGWLAECYESSERDSRPFDPKELRGRNFHDTVEWLTGMKQLKKKYGNEGEGFLFAFNSHYS